MLWQEAMNQSQTARSEPRRRRRRPASIVASSLFALSALALAACEGDQRTRGNLLTEERMAEISAGQSLQSDVVAAVGTPSAVSTFEGNTWYYIGERQEQRAFLDPNILERNVLVVNFDDEGLVESTELYTVADGQYIQPVGRTTPTEGRKLTILQQLLGNIGRFNPDGPEAGGGN